MGVKSGDKKSVALRPLNMALEQSKEMTLFTITDYELVRESGPKGGIRMSIKMKRKILSEMMTTYFPSLLLMMITYATTFFKPVFFEAALSVNLTTMLVMTTIFISKMEVLPATSDVKMIDCWLILCQLVPFVQVVLLTAMEYLRQDEQGHLKKEKQTQKKRKREKKKKRKENKEEKENEETEKENNGEKMQNITPAKKITDGNLHLVIEIEDCIKQDEPLEAWTLDQNKSTKSSLLTKLTVIGEYLMITLI